MADDSRAPTFDAVVSDLEQLREGGIGRARSMRLPALTTVATLCAFTEGGDITPGIRLLLKEAVDTLGGGALQDAAEYSLGLYPGTALWKNVDRRRSAAEAFGVASETFRKGYEKDLVAQIAEAIMTISQEARLRQSRLEIQERRHPADSRLAVQWVERFEAYYRIWTPVYALGADLEAAIDTYREGPSEHPPWASDSDEPYDYIKQAQGYGHSALFRLAEYWLEVKRFKSRYGGLWLFSDDQVEQDVADAIYGIGWHNDLSDRDESFLRRHLADARHEEPAAFWDIIQAFPQAVKINERWQRMIHDGVGYETEEQQNGSQVWLTIRACEDYCRLVDDDWKRVADWYRPTANPKRPGVDGATLYQRHLGSAIATGRSSS